MITASNENMLAIPRARHKIMHITPVLMKPVSRVRQSMCIAQELSESSGIYAQQSGMYGGSETATEACPLDTAPSALLVQAAMIFSQVCCEGARSESGGREEK